MKKKVTRQARLFGFKEAITILTSCFSEKNTPWVFHASNLLQIGIKPRFLSLLLKNHFECSFVSSECSLQSSKVCFEVRSEYLR